MSGQPLKNPTDASKFRQQYLANLQLQAKNDQINLDANKIFKKTGQTPSQPTDTRTTAEKLADVERLKLDIRGGLREITDGTQANIIVENLSPNELEFLAQQMPTIIADIKPKYKNGILGAIFIPYLRKYKAKYDQTRGVEFGLQQEAGRHILLGIQQIQRDMIDVDLLSKIEENILSATSKMSKRRTAEIKREIDELKRIIPTSEELKIVSQVENSILKDQIQELLNDALQELPTKNQVMYLITQLNSANSMRNAQLADELSLKLLQILQIEPATKADMEEIKQMIFEIFRQREKGGAEAPIMEAQVLPIESLGQAEAPPPPPSAVDLTPLSEEEKAFIDSEIRSNPDAIAELRKKYVNSTKIKKGDRLGYIGDYVAFFEGSPDVPSLSGKIKKEESALLQKLFGRSTGLSTDEIQMAVRYVNRRIEYALSGEDSPMDKSKGYGLKKPRKRRTVKGGNVGIPRLQADYSNAIMPDIKYTPVGRYFLDHRKLGDNIISLKRGNGVNVSGFPIQRVSNDLGDVIRTIIGGGQPKFEKLEKLSQEEKTYLHKLAKASQIIDRINIPAPSKDDDEKDIHSFEVMKGEILSGNDSQELIKKFKLLIVKMINKGLLPKTQAKDLLMNLATLGY